MNLIQQYKHEFSSMLLRHNRRDQRTLTMTTRTLKLREGLKNDISLLILMKSVF